MEDFNKILEKIKKLLLKAGSTDVPAEAEVFLMKANELMVKWKVDQSQINLDQEVHLQQGEVLCGEFSLEGKWEIGLALAIAKFNGCHVIWYTMSKYKIMFGGESQDVEMTTYFFENARRIFRNLSRKQYVQRKQQVMEQYPNFCKKTLEGIGYLPYRSVCIRSFLHGCTHGLTIKLNELQEKAKTEFDTTGTYGLILTNQIEKSRQYMVEIHKPKTMKQTQAFGDGEGYMNGIKTGSEHHLTIGVESTKTSGKSNNMIS